MLIHSLIYVYICTCTHTYIPLCAYSLRGTTPLLQNFCAELEFLPEFLARSRTINRILGFVPVSISYFRWLAFVHTKPAGSWPELALIRAAFAPSPL